MKHRLMPISAICDITSSKRIYASEYVSEGIPFWRGKEIVEKFSGALDVSTELFISEHRYQTIKSTFGLPKIGDILLTSVGTIGVPYLVKRDDPFYFKDGNITWFRTNDEVFPPYLFYWLISPVGKSELSKCTIGSAQPAYTIVRLKEMQIRLPDLPTQQRIAGILSAYDDLIENNQRRIGLLEQAARLLYREWFVHLRFPGHETAKIVDGLPEGWERMPASEAMHINPRTIWKASESKQITMVPMGALSTSWMNCDPSLFERREQPAGVKFMNGDTLFARITPCLENGKTGYVNFLQEGEVACGSTEFVVFRERRISRFMAYLLAREEGFRKNAITSMVGSSGRQRVQPSCFDKYLVPVPPKSVVEDFDRVVEPMFREIEHIDKAISKLTRARDLLLPRLMDGRIPV